MVYQWKTNSRVKTSANVAGAVLSDLESKNSLTPKALLDVSRPVDAPLHNEFEWDDGIAAEKYRESQAAYIIRSIEVVREDKEPVRAFFKVKQDEPSYQRIDAIVSSKSSYESLLDMAKKEMQSFIKKYSDLEELRPVIDAMSNI